VNRTDARAMTSLRCRMFRRFLVPALVCLGVLSPASGAWAVSPGQAAGVSPQAPFEVQDAAGRRVSFSKLPQRIVVAGQGPFMPIHLLYLFPECKDRLVGYERKYQSVDDFLPLLDPQYSNKTALATNPGPEQIATLHPDLVVIKANTPTELGQSLAVLGIPVVYFGMEDPERFLREVEMAGLLFGNRARATEIVRFYQTRLDRIRTRVEAVGKEGKPRVLVMEYNEKTGKAAVQVPGRSWIQTIQAERAGGNPVWLEATKTSEGWTIVNFEQIASWNPDKMFVIPWFTLDQREVLASLRSDSRWSLLKAVKGNELYIFPSDIFGWDSAEPRWILGMTWLATKILPDRFADIDMKEEIHQFFEQMYSMERTVVDTAIMPKVILPGK
jgi:iron complex transport system substrate-binding protein